VAVDASAQRITSSCSGRPIGNAGAPQVRHFIVHMRRAGQRRVPPLNCGVMRSRRCGFAVACAWLALPVVLALVTDASADCSDIPNLLAELPIESVTPKQTHLTYSYNINESEYSVSVRRDAGSYLYAGLPLERNCHPGTLRWESGEFVLLERGCGTFCWGVEVLSTTAQRRFSIFRPVEFFAERKLVVSYPEWDAIGVSSLATGYVQSVPTALHCQSSAEVCFDVRIEGDSLIYVWQNGSEFAVPLDRRLFE
jgi:hypothetical protein